MSKLKSTVTTVKSIDAFLAGMKERQKAAEKVAKANELVIQSMLDSGVLSCPCRILENGHIEIFFISTEPSAPTELKQLQDAVGGRIEIVGCGKFEFIVNENGRLNGSKPNRMFPMFYGNIVLMRS